MSETVNADRLAKVYVKIREKRKELAKQDRELEEQLELVAHQLLEICKEQGAATIRTQHGTISQGLINDSGLRTGMRSISSSKRKTLCLCFTNASTQPTCSSTLKKTPMCIRRG
jgi:hypothetical protein